MKKEYFLLPLITVFATLGAIFLMNDFSLTTHSVTSVSSDEGNSIAYHSNVCVSTRSAGETEWHLIQCKHNLFTEAGKNITRDLLAGQTTTNNISVIALGNGTLGSGAGTANTSNLNMVNGTFAGGINAPIPDCGLGPASGTIAYQQNNNNCQTGGCSGNWTITKTFTNNCAANTVNQTGLFNTTGGATTNAQPPNSSYFAGNVFTAATLQTNDQINITWFIWVS